MAFRASMPKMDNKMHLTNEFAIINELFTVEKIFS